MDLNPRESNLEKYLRTSAANEGWRIVKYGVDGWPDDLVIATEGVVGWIELKRRGMSLEPRQALRIEELQARGFLACSADVKIKVDWFIVRLRELVADAKAARVGKRIGIPEA